MEGRDLTGGKKGYEMNKKKNTAWNRVPKEKRKKVILQGIKGALIGYMGFVPDIQEGEHDKPPAEDRKE